MKKIITLLIAAGAFVAVNAQSTKDEARKVILGQEKNKENTSQRDRDIILGGGNNENNYPNYPNSYPNSRNSSVDQINREYDAKIWSIRNNNTLSSEEKSRIIRQLEKERAQKIRKANQNNRDYNSKGKKYDKHDNGKHKGWTKGKGNQKKNKHWDD